MNRKLILYFDNCCYSRLFDLKTSLIIRAETARIRDIIRRCLSGEFDIIGSFSVVTEMRRNPDAKARRATERLYNRIIANEVILSARGAARAVELESKGLRTMDARHLASAEEARADFLITTDMDFIKKCSKPNFTAVTVINPTNF